MLQLDCGERGRVTDITAKATADAHKHVSMCINILRYLFHGYTLTHTHTGDSCMCHKESEWAGGRQDSENRELKLLKPILICQSWSCCGLRGSSPILRYYTPSP